MEQPIRQRRRYPALKALQKRLSEYRWLFVALAAIEAAAIGFVEFGVRYPDYKVLDRVFLTFKLFLFDPGVGPPMPIGILIAFVLAGSVTAFASLRALTNVLAEQTARFKVRVFYRGHVVICGAGEAGTRLAREFEAADWQVVVVEQNPVARGVAECKDNGCVVLIGNALDETTLRQAGIRSASLLVAVCTEDATNAEIATVTSRNALQPLHAVVRVTSAELCELVRDTSLRLAPDRRINLEFLNPIDAVGPALAVEHAPSDSTSPVVVLGMGDLGSRLAMHVARSWAIARKDPDVRLSITVGGPGARQAVDRLTSRYPALEKAADITLLAESADPEGVDGNTVVFVSLPDDASTLATAVRLSRTTEARVVACTTGELEVGDLIDTSSYGDLHVVSIPDRVYRMDVVSGGIVEYLARAIHEQYVRQGTARGETRATNSSLTPWDELPNSLHVSNRAQAVDMLNKLQQAGYDVEPWIDWSSGVMSFSDEEVETMAIWEHNRWWKERLEAGWTLGDTKDADARVSPHLRPYDELTEDVKELDRDTVRNMPMFLAMIGYRITGTSPVRPA